MFREHGFQRREVQTVVQKGREHDFRAVHVQQPHDVEIMRIVDDDAIAWRQEESRRKIEPVRGRIPKQDLSGVDRAPRSVNRAAMTS